MFTCFRKTNHSAVWSIYQSQFHNDCSNAYTRSMRSSGLGLGRDLENVALSLQGALEREVPMTMTLSPSKSGLFSGTAKDDACCFLPITNCLPNKELGDVVPISHRQENTHELGSIGRYVTRQKQWLRKRVHDTARPIISKLTTPCAVLHVMRIDDIALHGSQPRTYFPLVDYFRILPNTSDSIFLLTDDANVITEALNFFPHINWVFLNVALLRNTSAEPSNHDLPMKPTEELVIILTITKILSR
jgi:hypothetical protein